MDGNDGSSSKVVAENAECCDRLLVESEFEGVQLHDELLTG